jgi:hypothetical protein
MVRIFSSAAAAALLSACATQMPQNAEEFRQAAPGAFMGKTETVEVNRPFREVAATFQKKAPECLDISVRTTSQTGTSYSAFTTVYKPTVLVTKERAELHVQTDIQGRGIVQVGKMPEGGYYRFVADAYPLGGNRTRLQWFGASVGQDVLIRAVKAWASGENLGCPDFTKQ